jgi:retron-type reverse transcriptase
MKISASSKNQVETFKFGYRPKRTAHKAIDRVARAIVQKKTHVIDIDLRSYFDNAHMIGSWPK